MNPYFGPTNDQQPTTNNQQPTTNDQRPTTNNQRLRTTDQLTTEKLKYSCNRAQWRQCPTNNLLEVWQNLAPFSGRPIGAAVEALLMIVVNWQSLGDHEYCRLLFFM
jgi:hypothetical protein